MHWSLWQIRMWCVDICFSSVAVFLKGWLSQVKRDLSSSWEQMQHEVGLCLRAGFPSVYRDAFMEKPNSSTSTISRPDNYCIILQIMMKYVGMYWNWARSSCIWSFLLSNSKAFLWSKKTSLLRWTLTVHQGVVLVICQSACFRGRGDRVWDSRAGGAHQLLAPHCLGWPRFCWSNWIVSFLNLPHTYILFLSSLGNCTDSMLLMPRLFKYCEIIWTLDHSSLAQHGMFLSFQW